jgi:RNA polymerase sigma-70 factor, ECF subfamily
MSGVEKGKQVAPSQIKPERSALAFVSRGARSSHAGSREAPMGDGGETVPRRDPAEMIKAVAALQDRSAFAALFDLYAPRVKTLLVRRGTTAEIAEDIAQETLLMVWQKAAYYDPSRASPSAWIYTIARNVRIDRLRRDKRARLHMHFHEVEPDEPERPDVALDAKEREQRLRAALGQLSDDQVRVVQLSFFEGRSHGDIAGILDIPLGTVKSRIRLALSRLRELLDHLL